ncbi:MAG: hypothetical protein HC927_09630 [Deltaproteobacteria bacterium]|nr:hypothetical protein [Deltaproteobacteria bacterium]
MQRHTSISFALVLLLIGACNSREDRMREQLAYDSAAPKDGPNPADEVPKIPPDPTRDALAPLLSELYASGRLPDVQESNEVQGEVPYTITNPGPLAIINVKPGLSTGDKAKAIIRGAAKADAFNVRKDADRYFPEQLERIKNSFGAEQRDAIWDIYGDLRLLDFFTSDKAEAALAKLEGDAKTAATELRDEIVGSKDQLWERWMGIKMYARREVAYDQPFKPVLRSLRAAYGMKEPEPITWESAHGPEFQEWAKAIDADDELFKMLTNLSELRAQEEFRGDTHARWLKEGSADIPEVAQKVKIDKELGFGVHREDLGGGYQEMTFVFAKNLSGDKLKEAYIRSLLYRQVFTDFATLSAAGATSKPARCPTRTIPTTPTAACRWPSTAWSRTLVATSP